MTPWIRHLLLLVLIAAAVPVSRSASAGYVFFSSTFGDWSVLCWTDEGVGAPVGSRHCSLKAPPPRLEDALPPQRGHSVITVSEQQADMFLIFVQVPGVLKPGSPVYLRVDDNEPVTATPNRYGEAVVTGNVATALIAAMSAGKTLVLRSYDLNRDTPRDETILLESFAKALAVYRQNLRANGILAAGTG